ncbi:DMT family transporter [Sulfitobacter sp. S190]|uniref:DMT family transporter n=1 Tax=Sulfitobacter sp. S190 TaxID=2867022 RepID=UPI0021A85622|nr:DMT family transporter [Sulfitobacter sp. S190]UWR23794.1 DMT family transporter [Sulfitobacter sp. S190]
MNTVSQTTRATLIVVLTGLLWGFYWWPVRTLESLGLTGAWGTVGISIAGLAVLIPVGWRKRHVLRHADRIGTLSVFVGGAAFALYSIGFIYGRVALVILLFFLTPVWSTLIARVVLGRSTPLMRMMAIGVGLAGLTVMLSAQGNLPVPRNLGEWMGLASGLFWAIASTGIRERSELGAPEAAFVFVAGAAIMAAVLAPLLAPLPQSVEVMAAIPVAAVTGVIWWGISMGLLMWATARLDPARTGILLMSEVLVGAASAAVLASEHLSALEMTGGALVLLAGLLEVWPERTGRVA